jgi:hypothetical protein
MTAAIASRCTHSNGVVGVGGGVVVVLMILLNI